MKLIELNECHSTQEYLKNQLGSEFEEIVVVTQNQTKGKGQRGKTWHHFKGSLAMSISYPMRETITLIPLQIGVNICDYFSNEGIDLKLKWPNDLLTKEGKKIGGIIVEVINPKSVAVGIGLNLYDDNKIITFDFPHDFLFSDQKQALDRNGLVQFIYKNSMTDEDLINQWQAYCLHLKRKVRILDEGKEYQGYFQGIGENGEALLLSGDDLKKFYTGSLSWS